MCSRIEFFLFSKYFFKDRNVHFCFFHYSFDLPNSSDISQSKSFTSISFTNFTANCCGLNTQESVLDSLEFVDTIASERTTNFTLGLFRESRGFPKLNCMNGPFLKNNLNCFV